MTERKTYWQRFCVVGLGGHARSKLIPAIRANGQELVGVVSRSSAADVQSNISVAHVFAQLDDALAAVPSDTAFLLASPPTIHADQAQKVLAAGYDLLIEKPGFVSVAHARAAASRASAAGVILAEAFMQRHTRVYGLWLEHWARRRPDAVALEIAFVVPSLPNTTFRANSAVGASSLYDIGSYVVALLGDLEIDHSRLAITGLVNPGALTERVTLTGSLDGVAVTATVGVASEYVNRVALRWRNNDGLLAKPFFFGRPGARYIEMVTDGVPEAATLIEGDAYQAMLARPRAEWLAGQRQRLDRMIAATATLERLGAELIAARAGTCIRPQTL